jgi:hypothetical protein
MRKKTSGRADVPVLMAASGIAVAFIQAVVRGGAVWERLRYGKPPQAPLTDMSGTGTGVHPGVLPVRTPSVFRSMDERRDT